MSTDYSAYTSGMGSGGGGGSGSPSASSSATSGLQFGNYSEDGSGGTSPVMILAVAGLAIAGLIALVVFLKKP